MPEQSPALEQSDTSRILFERYHPSYLRTAAYFLRLPVTHHDVEDTVQSAYLRFMSGNYADLTLQHQHHILRSIVRNHAFELLRRNRRRPLEELSAESEAVGMYGADTPFDDGDEPITTPVNLTKISPIYRLVLLLRRVGLKRREIAEITGDPPERIKKRLAFFYKKIRTGREPDA